MNFTQTSSIVRRFRVLTVFLGLFLLLEFFGIFASSQTFLQGLRELNQINMLTDLASRGISNLGSARETLEKNQSESVYDTAFGEVFQAVTTAQGMHPVSPVVDHLLSDAKKSLQELDRTAKEVYSLRRTQIVANNETIKKDLLIVKQFELDINESLRGAQIELSKSGNEIFSAVYRGRLTPVYVSLVLTVVFFIIALMVGFYTTRRLSQSLGYLLLATDEVARGNLNIRVPILDHDEIGRLSTAFDGMVQNLDLSLRKEKTAAERISRLQDITAEFSRALDPAGVGNAVVLHGNAELKATGGFVMILSQDREYLELISASGYPEDFLEEWKRFSVTTKTPAASATLQQIEFFCENEIEVRNAYDPAIRFKGDMPKALACVPLLINEVAIGALIFTFENEKTFSTEERDFVIALADLAAQALQRAKLYDDAQKAIQVREEFLSIASHELKTPITSLKMQLQLAQMHTKPEENIAPTPQKLARMFEVSVTQVNRLTSLVDDLLDVSRFEAGKLSFDFAQFDLSQLLKEVLERFDSALKAARSPAEVLTLDSVSIYADAFRIEQVIVNLLSNAMKYGTGKPIQIALVNKGRTAELSIQDHGIGIPLDKQALIFERFERAANTQNIGGLGLGLYIARQIVQAHQGTIIVKSVPNEGSLFTVILPLQFSPKLNS